MSAEDQLEVLRAMEADKAAKKAWLDDMLRNDQAHLLTLLFAMNESERVEYILSIDPVDVGRLVEQMDEDQRIACLRSMPVTVQVKVLNSLNEQYRTSYMRWLGQHWHANPERKALGRALMDAMTP